MKLNVDKNRPNCL